MSAGESEVAQLCLTLYNPVDCSPPGSSLHHILQARVLEWVAISKECSDYRTIALISHAIKVMLNILQARLQQYVNFLEKAGEPEIKLATSAESWKKQGGSRKTSIPALLTVPKPLTIWITVNCGKF